MTYRSLCKQPVAVLFFCVSFLFFHFYGSGSPVLFFQAGITDTVPGNSDADTTIDSHLANNHFSPLDIGVINRMDTVTISRIDRQPFVSLQQMLKGNVAGAYIQEPSGEPGAKQYIFLHGINSPLLNKKDLVNSQPVIYVNGIPLITENPYAYDIQRYDFNRIGPFTNYLADLNANDISSIKVITDPAALAALGPDAANGAIWVTTKNAHSGFREISINSYVGFAQKPVVTPVNAAYENAFRLPFYDEYRTVEERLKYPAYLRDSTNKTYYGPSNWTDLYYKTMPLYSVDMSLTGGSDRANFRFLANKTQSKGNADGTSLDRYGVSFFINMLPLKWLTVSSMIRANRLERDRNHNIRDRLAEERYLPELTNPLSPNKEVYGQYLEAFEPAIDKNKVNTIQGYFGLEMDLGKLVYKGKVAINYNEGLRDVFWPTTLLEGNNFVSSYFGYNQRFIVSNSLNYTFDLGAGNNLDLMAAQEIQEDLYKTDYSYAYNGPNDFIKVNSVDGNPNHDDYLKPNTWVTQWNPDKQAARLASYYLKAGYTLHDRLNLGAIVRSDGSSNVQPDHRWLMTYALSGSWDVGNTFLKERKLSRLNLRASYAKIGKLFNDDRFAVGPQYQVDMGWPEEPTLGSYVGIAGLSRPFTAGWVGYNIPWQYSNKLDVGIDFGLIDNRVQAAVDFYQKDDKDLVLPVPVPTEYGYTGAYQSGLWIQNKGVDVSISARILDNPSGLNWLFSANFNTNKNDLKALPGGLEEIVIGNRKLKVGSPVDSYWLLNNKGIYNEDGEVPVNPNNQDPITYNGVPLEKGDAKWTDVNGDYVINNDDKTLQGHFMPKMTGGFGSDIAYKGWIFNFHFFYVLGRDVLNSYASSRMDFINGQNNNDIHSVKEITFWEKRVDLSKYPRYNPWSNAIPYREDQDLFLENGSFLKLRSVSLSYDLRTSGLFKGEKTKDVFRKFLLYVSASNLLTISPFKTDDPELTLYNGVYDGYGLPIPASFTFGVKIDL